MFLFWSIDIKNREWFSSSSYRAVADEVTVGTKKVETAPAVTTPVEPIDVVGLPATSAEDSFGIQ